MNDLDRYLRDLDRAFDLARAQAQLAADKHNENLCLVCPSCKADIVPGLPCYRCDFQAELCDSWYIIRSDEFGFILVPIGAQRTVLAVFHIAA